MELQKSCNRGQKLATCGRIWRESALIYALDSVVVTCLKVSCSTGRGSIRNAKVVGSIPASGVFCINHYGKESLFDKGHVNEVG